MPLLETRSDLPKAQKVLYVLFTLTFLILPFYYQDNLGGEGMSIPFNAVIWIGVLGVCGSAVLKVIKTGYWVKPPLLWLLLLFPAGILAVGFISGMERPGEWIIRLGVVIGGILFWFSVLQFQLKRRDFENLLYLLLAACLIHAMVGLLQILPNPLFKGWIPVSANHNILGMFQQPNLQASLLATAGLLAIYLASVPGFSGQRWMMKALILLTLFLAVFEVVGSGSRVGLLGLLLGLALLVLARRKSLLRRGRWAALLLALILVGGYTGIQLSGGKLIAYSKIERLADEGKDVRPHIYAIAFDVFERSPLIGHGIGSFQREFQDQRAIYYDPEVGEQVDSARFSHPHNEMLFWMIEGGILAVAAIMAAALAVFIQFGKLGWQRGGALAALLLPITAHTQTELPFYISTLHWLVLLVLLGALFQTGSRARPVRLSTSLQVTLTGTSLLLVPLLSVFLANSLLSQTAIMHYMKSRGAEPKHLDYALDNLYFREMGEYFMMRAMLHSNFRQGDPEIYRLFIEWAESFLEQIPEVQVYRDLAIAYVQMDDRESALRVINRGAAIYPTQGILTEAKERIERGEVLVPVAESTGIQGATEASDAQ